MTAKKARKPASKKSLEACRRELLDATIPLAEHTSLSEITFPALAKHTGTPLKDIEACFANRDEFLTALHQHFLVDLIESILAKMPPGETRLRCSVEAFLDRCVESRNLRRQLIALERDNPAISKVGVARRNGFRMMLTMELKAIGIAQADHAARIFRTLIEEVSFIETEEARPNPVLREKIWQHLDLWRRTPTSR